MALHLWVRHHTWLLGRYWGPSLLLLASLLPALVVFIIVAGAALIRKVCRSLMLMRAAIVLEPPNDLIDVRGRVLIQLLVRPKDNDRDVDGAEYGQLMRLLEQAAFALEEGHGSKS